MSAITLQSTQIASEVQYVQETEIGLIGLIALLAGGIVPLGVYGEVLYLQLKCSGYTVSD
jgi:hypothetical protein